MIASEAAFWFSDEGSSNPDVEIMASVRPALATTGGLLVVITSPYGKKEVYETHRRHFGAGGDASIMVVQGASRDFNPTLPERVVQRAFEHDPEAASAEYGGQFRDDLAAFVSRDAVLACVDANVRERPPRPGIAYQSFVDPSGGANDSMTCAIGHRNAQI